MLIKIPSYSPAYIFYTVFGGLQEYIWLYALIITIELTSFWCSVPKI